MVFVTVGTTKFPFNRLLRLADEMMIKKGKKEKLVVQAGASDYQFQYRNVEVFEELPFDKMIEYLKKARIVIGHGGLATICLALKFGKNKPLIIPRMKKFGEHVDDQQIFLSKFFKKRWLIETVFPEQNLEQKIEKYIKLSQKNLSRKKITSSKKLIKKLTEYIESIR